MRTIFLVKQDEAEIARHMEKILLYLPVDSGILFVSVSVIQDTSTRQGLRKALYQVVIGCDRSRDPDLINLLAKTYLKPEVRDESQLVIEVHRGLDRRSLGT